MKSAWRSVLSRVRTRDEHRSPGVDEVIRDLRYAVRSLLRAPTFTAAVVLSLAVSIGAVSTVYTVTDRVVLRSLPYREAGRLVTLWTNTRDKPTSQGTNTYLDIKDWTTNNPDFESSAMFNIWSPLLFGEGEPEPLAGASVTHEFFRVLGTRPAIGRGFLEEDEASLPARVVVIAHSLWQRRFASDAAVIGKTISLSGLPYTIVGIMPEGFRDPELTKPRAEIWRPLVLPAGAQTRRIQFLRVIARLNGGAAIDDARRHLDALAARLAAENPKTNENRGVYVLPMHDQIVGQSRTLLFAALGAALCLLLIACGNVVNFVLTRHSARATEIAVRTALGAARTRVIRMLFAESVVLAAVGGALGIFVAFVATGLLRAGALAELPRAAEIGVDARIVGVCALITIGASLVFGLVPALRSSREDIASLIRAGGLRTKRSEGVRGAIIVAEVALSLTLLTSTLLLGRSALSLSTVRLGLDVNRVFAFTLAGSVNTGATQQSALAFMQEMARRLTQIPGVDAAATTSVVPLTAGDNTALIAGSPSRPSERGHEVHVRTVAGPYFAVVGLPIVRGRPFDERDAASAPLVAIINEHAAREMFGGEDPIGKPLLQSVRDTNPPTIVGVVADARSAGPASPIVSELFQPSAQASWGGSRSFVIRTRRDPEALSGDVRATVRSLGASLAVTNASALSELASAYSQRQRFYGSVIGLFAIIGLVLSAIGIYGLIAYSVVQRQRELAIRMALGSSGAGVVLQFVKRAAVLSATGLGFGAILSIFVRRMFEGLLFGVTPGDPTTIVVAAGFLALIAVVASALPARGAVRMSIVETLRSE